MQWGSLDNFINMGGYGFYVWSAYGMCVAAIVLEVIAARSRRRKAEAEVRRLAAIATQRRTA